MCPQWVESRHSASYRAQMFLKTRRFALAFLLVAGCSEAAPPPDRPSLNALLQEKKFETHDFYTGVDTPEDAEPLRTAVDDAIKDIGALSDPLEPTAVRNRLSKLIEDTDLYATEDRDQVARYAIRIWRAAGFTGDSGLFGVSDEKVLSLP